MRYEIVCSSPETKANHNLIDVSNDDPVVAVWAFLGYELHSTRCCVSFVQIK